jgi:hypothetical protein
VCMVCACLASTCVWMWVWFRLAKAAHWRNGVRPPEQGSGLGQEATAVEPRCLLPRVARRAFPHSEWPRGRGRKPNPQGARQLACRDWKLAIEAPEVHRPVWSQLCRRQFAVWEALPSTHRDAVEAFRTRWLLDYRVQSLVRCIELGRLAIEPALLALFPEVLELVEQFRAEAEGSEATEPSGKRTKLTAVEGSPRTLAELPLWWRVEALLRVACGAAGADEHMSDRWGAAVLWRLFRSTGCLTEWTRILSVTASSLSAFPSVRFLNESLTPHVAYWSLVVEALPEDSPLLHSLRGKARDMLLNSELHPQGFTERLPGSRVLIGPSLDLLVDALAERVKSVTLSSPERLSDLMAQWASCGFAGPSTDLFFTVPQSLAHVAFSSKRSLPIVLSVLLVEACTRAGLEGFFNVSAPRHFLAGWNSEDAGRRSEPTTPMIATYPLDPVRLVSVREAARVPLAGRFFLDACSHTIMNHVEFAAWVRSQGLLWTGEVIERYSRPTSVRDTTVRVLNNVVGTAAALSPFLGSGLVDMAVTMLATGFRKASAMGSMRVGGDLGTGSFLSDPRALAARLALADLPRLSHALHPSTMQRKDQVLQGTPYLRVLERVCASLSCVPSELRRERVAGCGLWEHPWCIDGAEVAASLLLDISKVHPSASSSSSASASASASALMRPGSWTKARWREDVAGVVETVDTECQLSEVIQLRTGVRDLSRGAAQPFYVVAVDTRSTSRPAVQIYSAEELMTPQPSAPPASPLSKEDLFVKMAETCSFWLQLEQDELWSHTAGSVLRRNGQAVYRLESEH